MADDLESMRQLTPEKIQEVMRLANIIYFVGLYACYRKNRNGDSLRFIERYVSLTVPIGIRLGVFGLFVYAAALFAIAGTAIVLDWPKELVGPFVTLRHTNLVDVVFEIGLTAVGVGWIYRSIGRVASERGVGGEDAA